MQTEEIDALIQQRANLESSDAAHRAGIAVLTELGRREIGGEGSDLASQLPQEYKTALTGAGESAGTFTESEFIDRVGSTLNLDQDAAKVVAHASISAIVDSVTPGERTDFLNSLPREFSGYGVWN